MKYLRLLIAKLEQLIAFILAFFDKRPIARWEHIDRSTDYVRCVETGKLALAPLASDTSTPNERAPYQWVHS